MIRLGHSVVGVLLLLLLLLALVIPGSFAAQSTSTTNNSTTNNNTSNNNNETNNNSDNPKNPFSRGCLIEKLPDWTKPRVCHSEDVVGNANANANNNNCRWPDVDLDYMEVRIKAQDWESSVLESWILQIILSELLNVPTTIENGVRDSALMNFYDARGVFELGDSTGSLKVFDHAAAAVGGDCRTVANDSPHQEDNPQQDNDIEDNDKEDNDDYQICAHVILEIWQAKSPQIQTMVRDQVVAPPASLGALGIQGWYIPKFTALADPSLTSYMGYQGEANRAKLAHLFLRPTTWKDYCDLVSTTNCSTTDAVAVRRPETELEHHRMFVEGLYTGHFRNTTHNDCDNNNTNDPFHKCTGSIGDFPCGWSGATEAICYHLDIALESNGDEPNSGGYTYPQLGEMWKAANATRTHVIITYDILNPTYELFQNTEFEFIKVTLPSPTQDCIKNKVNTDQRCSDKLEDRVGVAKGVCDEVARPLHKLILNKFYDWTAGPDIPTAIQSPAHHVLSQFTITELQISELFAYQASSSSPREAVCQWAVDNLEELQQLVPPSYPRVLQQSKGGSSQPILYGVTIAMAVIATVLVTLTSGIVYYQRDRTIIKCAQVEFLFLLLVGSLSVAIGAILTGAQPTDGLCISQIWMIGLGYTLIFVPLLVKVGAINQLMHAARRMRRVQLNRSTLHKTVASITAVMVVFLICWTVLDPPQKTADFAMTDDRNEDGDTIVHVQYYCSSESDAWGYVLVGWNLVLILCATAIAFQTWSVQQDFNEAQILSKLIYSHFLFVVLRAMTFFLPQSVAPSARSIIFSVDVSVMIVIYFLPKFLAVDAENRSRHDSGLASRISGLDLEPSHAGTNGSSTFHWGAPTPTARPFGSSTRQRQVATPTLVTSDGSTEEDNSAPLRVSFREEK